MQGMAYIFTVQQEPVQERRVPVSCPGFFASICTLFEAPFERK